MYYRSEVLIVGSGLSACAAALTLADKGIQVSMLCPTETLDGGNSDLAQGGIVFVHDNPEEFYSLEKDMLNAGHDYNFVKAVRHLADHGGEAVQQILIDRLHVPFNKRNDSPDEWDLTLEAGHSAPRILHCADYTGHSIIQAIHKAVLEHRNINVRYKCSAVDLITTDHHSHLEMYRYQLQNQCVGVYAYNVETEQVDQHLATFTILATGGVGNVFLHSTNSDWAVGSGISMAQRAGVRLANMEFVQFHPTSLYHKSKRHALITEALRGEGAILLDLDGREFMQKYDKRKSLAPRDIVSQAIATEMLMTGSQHVYLDATKVDCDVTARFPTVFQSCMNIGVDMRKDYIPVVPSAHYFCGGILVDLNGRTTLENLYAVGECSCTGIHGANRLASTSLLEALLWGFCAGKDIAENLATRSCIDERVFDSITDWKNTGSEHNDDPALIAQDWASIRHIMWNYVGIMRTESRLRRAFGELRDLSSNLHDFYRNTPLSPELVRLFHGCNTAYLITQAALRNKSSLGCHHRAE